MALVKVGQGWQFNTESDLEELIWRNLPDFLNLHPLSRQFSIDGKFCDILAEETSSQLVIIELKNVEDRYVIQQLTRYYDALISLQPSELGVDFDKPIRLIAIAPSFHIDTLVDCKYNTLEIELIIFSIEAVSNGYQLTLKDTFNSIISQLLLPKSLESADTDIQVSDPPRKLLNWLSHASSSEFEWALKLRQKLLSFDPHMKEVVEPQRIIYGRGKSKPCCELRKVGSGGYINKKLAYFLWVPHPENKAHVIRAIVGFELDSDNVHGFMYCPYSYQTKIPWRFPNCIERMQQCGYSKSLEQYAPFLNSNKTISPANIVNLALQTWKKRFA